MIRAPRTFSARFAIRRPETELYYDAVQNLWTSLSRASTWPTERDANDIRQMWRVPGEVVQVPVTKPKKAR